MQHEPFLTLQTLIGPYGGWFRVSASGGGGVIGRTAEADVCLLHESIGREHARVMPLGSGWMIVDLGSATGTSLNGVRLDQNTPTPIAPADLLRLGPWTFRVSFGGIEGEGNLDGDASISAQRQRTATPSATFRLRLLSTLLSRLSQSTSEEQMAKVAVETALEGTGLSRGAMLRPLESPDPLRHDVSVVAAVGMTEIGRRERVLGREVLDAAWKSASRGSPAAVHAGHEGDATAKLVCAPVMLGQTLVSFVYLDAESATEPLDADAAEFVEAVSASYALALANLRRLELDRRQQALAAELHAARDAQRFILPPTHGDHGFLSYAMEMIPGMFVAGDLFDVVPLRDGRVAVCLGDVAGHGAGSAMLMATTQSYLHAQLLSGLEVDEAVTAAGEFLGRKLAPGSGGAGGGGGRFVSLWTGVFDQAGNVEFVDAGHSHWLLVRSDGTSVAPNPEEAGIPLGIDPATKYRKNRLHMMPGDRVVVFSDGLVEQRRDGSGAEFGISGVKAALAAAASPAGDVQGVVLALHRHAGHGKLADDATIASIQING